MRRLLTSVMILSLATPLARAGDKPDAVGGDESYATIKAEYDAAIKAYAAEYKAAYEAAKKRGDETAKAFKFEKPSPGATFTGRFLAVAEKNPEGPDAIPSLKLALQTGYASEGKPPESQAKALKILERHHATKPEIKGLLGLLTLFDGDENAQRLVDEVIAHNPDRKVQAAAYKGRLNVAESLVNFAESMKKDSKRRASVEASMGKEWVSQRLAKAEKASLQIEPLKSTLREKYAEYFIDLSVGHTAPEVVSQDLEGKTVKLSDLKGKVVVLDIWATWCGPCRAMIPHEREMVGRLGGKPFQLVGLSIDDEVKTLKDFLAKEKLPWTHWWAGPGGWQSEIVESWNIRGIPAIFVLDGKGVIRYRDVRGEELEKAISALLKETEVKTADRKAGP